MIGRESDLLALASFTDAEKVSGISVGDVSPLPPLADFAAMQTAAATWWLVWATALAALATLIAVGVALWLPHHERTLNKRSHLSKSRNAVVWTYRYIVDVEAKLRGHNTHPKLLVWEYSSRGYMIEMVLERLIAEEQESLDTAYWLAAARENLSHAREALSNASGAVSGGLCKISNDVHVELAGAVAGLEQVAGAAESAGGVAPAGWTLSEGGGVSANLPGQLDPKVPGADQRM